MDPQQFISSGLIELYALGITTADQAAEVERMAAEYPEVQRELDNIRTALERYGTLYTVQPPATLRDRILTIPGGVPNVPDPEPEQSRAPVSRTERTPSRNAAASSGPSPLKIGLVVLALLSLFLGGTLLYFLGQADDADTQIETLEGTIAERDAALATLREACAETENELATVRAELQFLQNPNTNPVELAPLRRRRAPAQAIVYWNAEQNRALINPINLPAIDGNQTYQLWAETPRGLLPVGTFRNAPASLQAVDFEEGAVNLYVSLEPLGGSTTPTAGQVKLIGGI